MTLETTIQKQSIVLKRFHQLLRSGKDYSTTWMYRESGKPCFIAEKRVAAIINSHYHGIISKEMVTCLSGLENISRNEQIEAFSKEFKLCEREARLIIRYIKMNKND